MQKRKEVGGGWMGHGETLGPDRADRSWKVRLSHTAQSTDTSTSTGQDSAQKLDCTRYPAAVCGGSR